MVQKQLDRPRKVGQEIPKGISATTSFVVDQQQQRDDRLIMPKSVLKTLFLAGGNDPMPIPNIVPTVCSVSSPPFSDVDINNMQTVILSVATDIVGRKVAAEVLMPMSHSELMTEESCEEVFYFLKFPISFYNL